ncbi:MFS transporter [Amycolatopsis sp. cg13]|uniref:MFS transporter n=1 Tax=Amycolatopsis sp. cg13 TaxID=3238807 RepID=UPI003524C766
MVASAEAPPSAAPGFRDWAGIGVVLLATFMGQIDMFIVNVASPPIQADLGASFGQIQFVIDGYVIAYAAGMVTGGKLGDRFGRKKVFQYGVASFTAASLLCALCPTAELLIAARVVQGAAAAVLMPQVLSIIQGTFARQEDRRRAIGAYGSVIGLGVVAGLIGGGLLLEADVAGLRWRTIFLINVPIGLVILLIAPSTVRESRSAAAAPLDMAGTVLTASVLPALLIPLSIGPEQGWPLWTWLCFAATALLTAVLFRFENRLAARGGDPLLPARLLRRRGFPASMATVTVFFAGNAGYFLVLTYYLQSALNLNPMSTGVVFVPLGAGFAVASAAGRRLAERYGTRVLITGALLMTLSFVPMPFIVRAETGTQAFALAATIGLSGIGQGLVVSPLIGIVMAQVPADLTGAGSGVLNTVTQAAMALGVAGIGTLYRAALGRNPQDTASVPAGGFGTAFVITCGVLALLALATAALSWLLGRPGTANEAGVTS